MKILYGIQSTGNGHISRSSKIIDHLIKNGCDVDVLMSGNNSQVNFTSPVKYQMSGFTLFYTNEGNIDYWKTFYNLNFLQFLKDIKLDVTSYDIIISDFEPITSWAAKLRGKECIGISNQCSFLSDKTPRPNERRILGEFLLKNMSPVTKPIGLHFDKYDDFIHTPIIKEILLNVEPINKGHYCVYLPTHSLENIVNKFSEKRDIKFEIFSNVKRDINHGNCSIKRIQKDSFDVSLRDSHGVITAAGFQTPSEALFLGKKLMVIPNRGQYEQECNAESLKRLGVHTGGLNDIDKFLVSENIVKVDWKDPTKQIVDAILSN